MNQPFRAWNAKEIAAYWPRSDVKTKTDQLNKVLTGAKSSEHKFIFQDFKRYKHVCSFMFAFHKFWIQISATIVANYLQCISKHIFFLFLSPLTLIFSLLAQDTFMTTLNQTSTARGFKIQQLHVPGLLYDLSDYRSDLHWSIRIAHSQIILLGNMSLHLLVWVGILIFFVLSICLKVRMSNSCYHTFLNENSLKLCKSN